MHSVHCCAETQDKNMIQGLKKLSSFLKEGHSEFFLHFTKISQTTNLTEDTLANKEKQYLQSYCLKSIGNCKE